MKINESELNSIILDLKEETYNLYYNQTIKDKCIDYEIVFNNAKEETKELVLQAADIEESIYEKILKETNEKKNKWIRYEINNVNSLYNNTIQSAKVIFEKDNSTINDFKNIDEYISALNKELQSWKANKQQDLTKFKYLERKRITTIKNALIEDIKVFLIKKIIDEFKKNNSQTKYEIQINSLTALPIDTTNKITMTENHNDYLFEYDTGEAQLVYQIKLDDVKNSSIVEQSSKVIKQILKVLNDKDVTIFQHLIKHRTDTFFQDGLVKFILDGFCKEVFGYCSTDRKNDILSSLTKMSIIKSKGYTDSNSGILMSLLGDVIVDSNQGKKTEVTTNVGLTYRNEIINGNVTKVYSHVLKAVGDNADARKLLFFLQKERIVIYYNRDQNEIEKYIQKRVPYTYFARAIIFTNKRKERVIKRIEEGLIEIVKNKAILLDYKRNGDFFNLYYEPVSEEEIKDLEMRIDTPISDSI